MYTFIDKIIISYTIFVNLGIELVVLSKRSRRVSQARLRMRKETDRDRMKREKAENLIKRLGAGVADKA